jgi:hypothetical protein
MDTYLFLQLFPSLASDTVIDRKVVSKVEAGLANIQVEGSPSTSTETQAEKEVTPKRDPYKEQHERFGSLLPYRTLFA